MTIRCAVIGVGYLGKFHAQKYAALDDAELVAVVDPHVDAGRTLAAELGCLHYTAHDDILDEVDAVSIVAPTTLHHQIASDCLHRGIHVLLEKPITTSVTEAEELIELAKSNAAILQVGHLERFNPAIMALGERLSDQLRFIEAHRLAPFKPRATDVSVMLDLMIHDIDIILNLVKSEVTDIRASGASVLSDSVDIANARLEFANGCVANVTASRISQKSERKMRIFQRNQYLTVDFQDKALDIYSRGDDEQFPGVPEITHEQLTGGESDALLLEIRDFLSAISHGHAPVVTGEDGKRALETAIRISALVPDTQSL